MDEAQNAKKVLLVDDDQLLRGMYEHKFAEAGFAVDAVGSANEALEKLRGGLAPSLIVFDIVMPGLDGYDFLEALGKEDLGRGAVKIALSNQTAEQDIERAKRLGVDAFITKATSVPSEVVAQVISAAGQVRPEH